MLSGVVISNPLCYTMPFINMSNISNLYDLIMGIEN